MEPVSCVWVGLDPRSTDGVDITILDLLPGPISAAPGLLRWWNLQQSGLTQTNQLLTAAHGACFPATTIHCCGAGRCCGDSEPGEDQGIDAVGRGRAPRLGSGGGKWESVLLLHSQWGEQLCGPDARWWPSVLLTEWSHTPPSTLRSAAEATGHQRGRAGHVGLSRDVTCAAPMDGIIRLVTNQVVDRKFLQQILL